MRISKRLLDAINSCENWQAYKGKGKKIDLNELPKIQFGESQVFPVRVVKYHPVDPRIPWMRRYAWPLYGSLGHLPSGELYIWSFKDCDPFADEYPYTD